MTKILKGATLIDGTGNPPIKNSIVIIEKDVIVAVGIKEQVAIPADADIVDITGKTLVPGLIDAHIHLDLHGMANIYEENFVEDKLRAIRAAREMELTLKNGITTIRSCGSVNHIDIAVKDAIEKGWIEGPRVLTCGQIISMTAIGNEYFNGMYREADGVDEVRRAAREQLKVGADFLKVMATGAYMNPGGVPGATLFNMEEIKVVVEEANKLDLRVAAHAHGKEGIINSIRAGVKTIEHGTFMDDEVIELLIEHDLFIIPTYVAGHLMLKNGVENGVPEFMIEKNKRIRETRSKNLRKAIEAGVRVAFGSDAGTNYNYHGNNALELILYVNEGFMSPVEAIHSGTRVAAEALGIEDMVGTVESGKHADLIVVDGSLEQKLEPLQDSIHMVFKAGKIVSKNE